MSGDIMEWAAKEAERIEAYKAANPNWRDELRPAEEFKSRLLRDALLPYLARVRELEDALRVTTTHLERFERHVREGTTPPLGFFLADTSARARSVLAAPVSSQAASVPPVGVPGDGFATSPPAARGEKAGTDFQAAWRDFQGIGWDGDEDYDDDYARATVRKHWHTIRAALELAALREGGNG
jgi:hypothetical protein